MMDEQQGAISTQPVTTASGVPIAVTGFGFSIITLSLFNVGALDAEAFGFFPVVAMTTGALAMLVGGLWEFRSNNVFGATFAVTYACFLLTTGVLLQYVAPGMKEAAGVVAFNHAFGAYLLVWALFTAFLTVGARYLNAPAFLAFALLVVVYLLAGLSNFASGNSSLVLTRIAGWAGILDGLAAWYLALAILLNDVTGRDLLPLRPYEST